jgi:hypothetical protein
LLLKENRNELLKHRYKNPVSHMQRFSNVTCLYGVEKDDFCALAKKNKIARFSKITNAKFSKGKCGLTEEMQRGEDVNVVV